MIPSDDYIRISGVRKDYPTKSGTVHALSNVDLTVRQGEFIVLVGPSGCGKTTLLKMLAGLLEPTSGTIEIAGDKVGAGRHGPDVGMLFQKPVLLPWRTILKNVLLPFDLRGRVTQEHRDRAVGILTMVGLGDFVDKLPDELSGGMQQRAAISRALVHQPSVLLMDEPFGALDAMTRDNLNVELNRIWRETRTTIVLITHSITEAVFLANRVVVMGPRPGRIIDIVDVPFADERGTELMDTPEFTHLSARLREYFEEER